VEGEEPDKAGTVKYAQLFLFGQEFGAMDSALKHEFGLTRPFRLLSTAKISGDRLFLGRLSAVPEAEACGWLKDKFGVSWQITPANMGELLARNPEKTTPVMLKMKKVVIADLEKAGESE